MGAYFADTAFYTMGKDLSSSEINPVGFSACGWGYRKTGIVADYGLYLALEIDNGTDWIEVYEHASGDYLSVASENAATASIITLPTNGWFWWGVVSSGSGAGNLKGYGALLSDATISSQTTTGTNAVVGDIGGGNDEFNFGNGLAGNGYCPDAILAYCKVWNAVLTDAEMERERWIGIPYRRADLWGFWPMWTGGSAAGTDYSGNGRTLTNQGDNDPVDDAHPPVTYTMTQSGLYVPLVTTKSLYEVLDEAILNNNDYAQLSL